MEVLDQLAGLWYNDQIYYLNDFERVYISDVPSQKCVSFLFKKKVSNYTTIQSEIKEFLNKYKNVSFFEKAYFADPTVKIGEALEKLVKNKYRLYSTFKTYQITPEFFGVFLPKNLKVNGRNYYSLFSLSPSHKIMKNNTIGTDLKGVDLLLDYIDREYYMYYLICSLLQSSSSDWLSNVVKSLNGNINCVVLGSKISKSLIKIAATRIFADPEQSILELPVNSIDAYSTHEKIGKFGMGFFSFLYWLVNHPKRSLVIESWVKENGTHGYFMCTVQEHDGNLRFNLKVSRSATLQSGSCITLYTDQDKLSDDNLNAFNKQLQKLKYIQSAALYVVNDLDYPNPFNSLDNKSDKSNKVMVNITNDKICVEDYATGIPLKVLLTSLFIPSISTKRIDMSVDRKINFVNNTRVIFKKSQQDSKLIILVGNIGVVNITIYSNISFTFIIDMPINTTIPVSRDDIILNDVTRPIFKKNISTLIKEAINLQNLHVLQVLLGMYKEFTVQQDIKEIINSIDYFNDKYLLVPAKDNLAYKELHLKYKIKPIVYSEVYDLKKIEEELLKKLKFDNNIFVGKNVVYHDLNLDVKLPTIVFVDNTKKDWMYNYTLSLNQDRFILVNNEYDKGKIDKYKSVIKNYTEISKIVKGKSKTDKYITQLITIAILKIDNLKMINPSANTDLCFETFISDCEFLQRLYQDNTSNLIKFINNMIVILSDQVLRASEYSKYGGVFEYINNYSQSNLNLYFVISGEPGFSESKLKILYTDFLNYQERAGITGFFNSYPNFDGILNSAIPKEASLLGITNAKNYFEYMVISGYFSCLYPPFAYNGVYLSIINVISSTNKMLQAANGREIFQKIVIKLKEFTHMVNKTTIRISTEDICKLLLYMNEYIKILSNEKIAVYDNFYKNIKYTYNTTTSSVINYVFHDNITKIQDFKNIEKSNSLLQITEIAINEGTTKPFINAMITETVQNSVDAIRQNDQIDNKKIFINIYKTNTEIVYEIKDSVGMGIDAILSVMIPFLSTKTPSQIVTGEMGSGFFNLYRESSHVIIDTTLNDTRVVIKDTPIKSGDRITDLKKEIFSEKGSSRGTTITVFIPFKNDIAGIITKIKYASMVMGLIPVSLYLNNEQINIKKITMYTTENFESMIIDNFSIPSYVLTKSIPFTELKPYFNLVLNNLDDKETRMLDNGLLVNIKHGAYIPIQSRTKINMDPKVKGEFESFLKESIYRFLLRILQMDMYKSKIPSYITYYNSTTNYDQLKFFIMDIDFKSSKLRDIITYYKSVWNNKSIASIINDCIDNKVYTETQIRELVPDILPEQEYFVKGWISYKQKDNDNKDNKIDNKGGGNKEEKKIKHKLDTFLLLFVKYYCKIGNKLKLDGFDHTSPKINVYENMERDVAALYDKSKNEIRVNSDLIENYNYKDFLKVIDKKKLSLINSLEQNTFYQKYLMITVISPIIVHELEHWRRQDNHAGSSHSDMNIEFNGEPKKTYTFDQLANKCFNLILQNGLWKSILDE